MNGYTARDGSPFINPLTGQPTKFTMDGDPGTGQGWVDGMAGLTPQDRRMCLVTGPFTMANGDTQELVVATMIGQGADRISSIAVLKYYADQVKAAYAKRFQAIPPSCSAITEYPSADSALATIRIDAALLQAQSARGNLKDSSAMIMTDIPFFDDGTHGDSTLGDGVFTNRVMVARARRPLTLDVTISSAFSGIAAWANLLPVITVAGPVTIQGPLIFSDNINSDGQPNFGENVRFGVSTTNATTFPLVLHLASSSGTHDIPSLPPGGTNIMSYNPDSTPDYFTADFPEAASNPTYIVPFTISDIYGNLWTDTLTFNLLPLPDTIKSALLAHPSGVAPGSFDVSIVDKAQVRNHVYIIQGVDSINSLGEGGFILRDSTDGRILLLNHPLPDSLGHNIPATDGFKVLRGTIDHRYGYRNYEIPEGGRVWSYVNGADLGLPGFMGAIGAGYDSWYSSSSIDPRHLTSILIRFASTDDFGNLLSSDDTLASYAYRYLQNASSPAQRPEFAPYIVNPTTGLAYQDYKHNLPFAAYDLGTSPPTRLMVGYSENNAALGSVDGRYWPPYKGNAIGNARDDGPQEWFFLFKEPYREVPSPGLQVDIRNNKVPMIWFGTPTRNMAAFHAGDEFIIRAFLPPTSNDIWTFNPEVVVSVEEQGVPHSFALMQNYPNPFNPSTRIKYTVGVASAEGRGAGVEGRVSGDEGRGASNVSLVVYDLLGREVALLVNEPKAAGNYEVQFDGTKLASGMYFYRLTAGSFVQTRKMILLK
jgi:hypothetical protein